MFVGKTNDDELFTKKIYSTKKENQGYLANNVLHKREEYVEDYKHQLGAYYLAHTTNYGPIEQGVISICTRDLQYQECLSGSLNRVLD